MPPAAQSRRERWTGAMPRTERRRPSGRPAPTWRCWSTPLRWTSWPSTGEPVSVNPEMRRVVDCSRDPDQTPRQSGRAQGLGKRRMDCSFKCAPLCGGGKRLGTCVFRRTHLRLAYLPTLRLPPASRARRNSPSPPRVPPTPDPCRRTGHGRHTPPRRPLAHVLRSG